MYINRRFLKYMLNKCYSSTHTHCGQQILNRTDLHGRQRIQADDAVGSF